MGFWSSFVAGGLRAERSVLARGGSQALGLATAIVSGTRAGMISWTGEAISRVTSNVLTLEADYAANRAATNHLPPSSQVISAFWGGQISAEQAESVLNRQGIPFGPRHPPGDNHWSEIWDKVIRAGRPTLDIDATLYLWRAGKLTEQEARNRVGAHGITRPATPGRGPADRDLLFWHKGWYGLEMAASLWRQGKIGVAEYTQAMDREGIGEQQARFQLLTQTSVAPLAAYEQWWLAGWIVDADYKARLSREEISDPGDHERLLRMRQPPPLDIVLQDYHTGAASPEQTQVRLALHGYGRDGEQRVLTHHERPLTPSEAVAMYHRKLASDADVGAAFAYSGIVEPKRQRDYFDATRPIPDPATLISFAVHEVWDQDVVNAFGYDAEYPQVFDFWMSQQGWTWGGGQQIPGVAQGAQADWPRLFWRAHWRPMSPTQGYRALHRLRPDRIARYADRVPGLEPFVWADMERVLRIADYPPKLRRWLAACSFSVLPIYIVRSLYRQGRRGRDWLVAQFRDRGFSEEDAQAAADNEDGMREARQQALKQRREDKLQRQAIDTLLDAYATGTFARDQAIENLKRYYVDETEAKALIDLRAAKENLALVKASVARLRRGFLAGEFAAEELPGQLARLGVVPDMVPRYVARWTVARSQERRQLSTERIVKYVAEGRMAYQVGLARLANLGWQNPDSLLLLEKAKNDALALEAPLANAERMPKQKRQRELEQVVARCTRLRDKVQADLRRMTPLSAIKRWLLDRIVSVPWARERMLLMGYDDSTTSNYIQSWGIEEDKALAKESGEGDGSPSPAAANSPTNGDVSTVPVTTIPMDSQGPKLTGGSVQIGEANP